MFEKSKQLLVNFTAKLCMIANQCIVITNMVAAYDLN